MRLVLLRRCHKYIIVFKTDSPNQSIERLNDYHIIKLSSNFFTTRFCEAGNANH